MLLALYLTLGAWPTWKAVSSSRHCRDYATYHYAVQAALDGESPYQSKNLSQKARKERTRRSVHPYFYPPPALLAMLWASPLSLSTAYKIFFGLSQLSLFFSLWICWKWLRIDALWLGILAVSFTPFANSITMGQINLLVLVLMLLALWKKSGGWLSMAAMIKMSPALLLVPMSLFREWSFVLWAVVGAIALSLLSLPIVGLEQQLFFYFDVLPQFSSGRYLDLKIPINLPGNHSVPDIFNQIWPGTSNQTLSGTAKGATSLSLLLMVIGLGFCTRFCRDQLGRLSLMGAFVTLMVVSPVYAYEHHLVFMAIPIVSILATIQHKSLPRSWLLLAVVAYVILAWKWGSVRWLMAYFQDTAPLLSYLIKEAKFVACLLIALVCIRCSALPSQSLDRAS